MHALRVIDAGLAAKDGAPRNEHADCPAGR